MMPDGIEDGEDILQESESCGENWNDADEVEDD